MENYTFISALVLGFIAGSSSCLAVAGGLLLSIVGKAHDRIGTMSKQMRIRFTVLFVIGRVVSYAILGGMIGVIGSTFTFSPAVTGLITLLASAYMIIAGLEMLGMSPRWLKCVIPRPPKWLANKILDADGHPNPLAPLILGAATFFLPCGFTQSLQIYAITTASFATSAMILGAFAIGTVPALLALGFASSVLNGKSGKMALKISGVFILYLAIGNVQNGFTLLGYPLTIASASNTSGYRVISDEPTNELPSVENGVQQLRVTLSGSSPYYLPSNELTVLSGKPVRLEVNGRGGGCRSVFQIPELGVKLVLNKEKNITEFTPKKPGTYTFSCSMGMYRGTLIVI